MVEQLLFSSYSERIAGIFFNRQEQPVIFQRVTHNTHLDDYYLCKKLDHPKYSTRQKVNRNLSCKIPCSFISKTFEPIGISSVVCKNDTRSRPLWKPTGSSTKLFKPHSLPATFLSQRAYIVGSKGGQR